MTTKTDETEKDGDMPDGQICARCENLAFDWYRILNRDGTINVDYLCKRCRDIAREGLFDAHYPGE